MELVTSGDMRTVIWWIRRDLRLEDNPALLAAVQEADRLIPLFILDPHLLKSPPPRRQAFLFSGLHRLDSDLRRSGSRLVVRSGDPAWVLRQIMAESGATKIFAGQDYSPYSRQRDEGVSAEGLPLRLLPGVSILHPAGVVKADGSPYTVFTPFSKVWRALALPSSGAGIRSQPAPAAIPSPGEMDSERLPEVQPLELFPPGASEARHRLDHFCAGSIFAYTDDRNRLDVDGTSILSPYLRTGMLSPRTAVEAAMAARSTVDELQEKQGVDTWINELIWREFYTAILYHFPHVLRSAFNPALRAIAWRQAQDDLQAWQSGHTGYPVVDAAMRQLAQTGWMHNRGRMIAASFLVKDLLIDWQEGEEWFLQSLVDGDPASNNGGWQWTAGVGTDAAPYFRVFNPVLQGVKFDPDGVYIRRWVPELADLPAEWIHRPWEMPSDVQRSLGFKPGRDYPLPIVDHGFARQRALDTYRKA